MGRDQEVFIGWIRRLGRSRGGSRLTFREVSIDFWPAAYCSEGSSGRSTRSRLRAVDLCCTKPGVLELAVTLSVLAFLRYLLLDLLICSGGDV